MIIRIHFSNPFLFRSMIVNKYGEYIPKLMRFFGFVRQTVFIHGFAPYPTPIETWVRVKRSHKNGEI
jgi:hypothetical protein